MVDYNFAAYPTTYQAVNFRSRLEARWAAFFDLLHWRWVYEPFDMGEWSPDFAIQAPFPILVEVKPIMSFDQEVADKMVSACVGENKRWMRSPGLLLLGVDPFREMGDVPHQTTGFGYCNEPHYSQEPNEINDWWECAVLSIWDDKNPNREYGFCHACGNFRDWIHGGYDGGSYGGGQDDEKGDISRLWATACNAVQWKPPKGA